MIPNCRHRLLRRAAACFPLLLFTGAAQAGVRPWEFPPVARCSRPVVVDGHLDEWAGVEGSLYRPLDARQLSGDEAALDSLRRWDLSAEIRWTHDAGALYVAVRWSDPNPAEAGDSLAIHLRADRHTHIVCAPAPDSPAVAVTLAGDTTNAPGAGPAAALIRTPGGYTEEVRIPWTLITGDGRPPEAGGMDVMLDLAWSELTPDLLKALPLGLLQAKVHTTMDFLTSPAKRYDRAYLPEPADWGALRFGGGQPVAVTRSPRDGTTGLTEMIVPSTEKPPTIDGSLTDWPDAAFHAVQLAPDMLGARYSGRLAARYDADKLYLAGWFSGPRSPFNLAREESQAGYGGGDALQMRLHTGGRTVNLCAWYDAQAGRPALTADGKDLRNPMLLEAGAEAAYRPGSDGHAYELAVPWAALGWPAPNPGDAWQATFQPWWFALHGGMTLAGALTLAKQGPLALDYSLPADGEVTLGLFDPRGRLLRWITRGDYRQAGANRERWDGLDQWGAPLPAGDYVINGITHPPVTLDYAMSLGNPGTPAWPTADGRGDWLSDEAPAQAAATDGKWVFLAAPGSEKGWAIIAVDERGQRQWGKGVEFYPRAVSLALSGPYLYALFSGPELTDSARTYVGGTNAEERAILMCLDARTGRPARFSRERPQLKVASWPYREEVVKLATLRARRGFTPGVYGGQPRYFCNDLGESTGALGLAALGDAIYLSMHYEDKLLVLDAGTAKPVGEIPLAQPVGLTIADGKILAVSGTRVVSLDPASKRVTPLITGDLLAPHSLATDRQGHIYVSDWGASFQVKVFSPEGKLLRAIGKPGGRPWIGAWEADGMLAPRGIAVTEAGELWVAEDDASPKRVSVWDARSGAFLKDYIGPAPYGGGSFFWVDPKDPTIAYTLGTRFKLDYAKKTATPLAIVFRQMDPDQLFVPNGHNCMANGVRTFYRDGNEYLAVNDLHMVFVLARRGDFYVPVAAAGGISRLITDDGTGKTLWDSDLRTHLYRNYYPAWFKGHAGDNFSWADANGDGLAQAEEMTWVKTLSRADRYADGRQPEWIGFWGAGIGPDGSLYYSGFCRDRTACYRLDAQEWTPGGAPVYDIARPKLLFTNDTPDSVGGYYVSSGNKLFVSYRCTRGPTDINTEFPTALDCRDRDGNLLWSVARPRTMLRKEFFADNVFGELTIPGVGQVLGTSLWWANYRPQLFTSDGLFLTTMLEDTRVGPLSTWDESYSYYFQGPDGTPYLVNGANDAHHLLAIRGLEKSERFTQPLRLTEADVAAVAATRQTTGAKAAPKAEIGIAWAASPPEVDGKLDDWDGIHPVLLRTDDGSGAEIALARDADALYLAYRVRDRTPLLNKGTDWQKLFITGDCVDLMLATDPAADPRRIEPAAGDIRLLLGVFQDQPIAVLYRPVAPGAKNPVQFMAARMDEVRKLTGARVVCSRGADDYTVEATVPLRELGIASALSGALRGDVGVIYSDETGYNRARRLYHFNAHTAVTSDLTTESTLEPAEWGVLQCLQ